MVLIAKFKQREGKQLPKTDVSLQKLHRGTGAGDDQFGHRDQWFD
jgi:hypothetical protein